MNTNVLVEQSLEKLGDAGKPIAVTLNAQEVGAMYAAHITPYQFMQLLLAKFKDAGVPIEGQLEHKLATGKVFKKKDDLLRNPGTFVYIWLPDAYVEGLDARGGVA